MQVLLDFPEVVKAYAPHFEECFTPEGYRHFQRLLSGLLIGNNSTLSGINSMFVYDVTHQSSLNRFVNRQNFSLDELNKRRIELMQQSEATIFKDEGCLGIDGTLLHHWGSHFDGITNLWDHVTESYGLAHELVSLYYSDSVTDYPLHYELWQAPDWKAVADHIMRLGLTVNPDRYERRDEERKKWTRYISDRYRRLVRKHAELRKTHRSKFHIAEDLLRHYLSQPHAKLLPLVVDSGFTSNDFCRTVSEELGLNYVADLRSTNLIYRAGGVTMKLSAFIEELRASHGNETPTNPTGKLIFNKVGYVYRGQKKTAWAYVGVHRLNSYDKKQKIVIHFNNEKLQGQPRVTITNRLNWYPSHILTIRRLRWPIETYHQQAKAHGLEDYQVRNKKAIRTHIAMVIVAYTMMSRACQDEELLAQLRERIQKDTDPLTLPLLRRLMQSGALWTLAQHIYLSAQRGESLSEMMEPILSAVVTA